MDLSAVHALAIEQTKLTNGVSAEYIRADGSRIQITAVWDVYELDEVGRSRQLARSLWLPTDDVPIVQRGEEIECPELHKPSTELKTWRIDKRGNVQPGWVQVLVAEVLE